MWPIELLKLKLEPCWGPNDAPCRDTIDILKMGLFQKSSVDETIWIHFPFFILVWGELLRSPFFWGGKGVGKPPTDFQGFSAETPGQRRSVLSIWQCPGWICWSNMTGSPGWWFFHARKVGQDESVLTNSFQRGLDEENGGRGFEDSGEILPSNQKKHEDFIYCS